MHPWARYDIPTSVILLLPLISMLVSPRHDSPIASMSMMHLSAESSMQYWLSVDGCIPGQDTIYQHLSYFRYHSYQCLSVPGMTLLSQPMMHLSAESMMQYWLTVDGCIPEQDTIYQHLSYYCYDSYQCLSVPGMTLLSYRNHANDASVSWEHDPPILIDCRWMHPWARYDIPTSVILLLQLISMLVSPRHDFPNLSMQRKTKTNKLCI